MDITGAYTRKSPSILLIVVLSCNIDSIQSLGNLPSIQMSIYKYIFNFLLIPYGHDVGWYPAVEKQ